MKKVKKKGGPKMKSPAKQMEVEKKRKEVVKAAGKAAKKEDLMGMIPGMGKAMKPNKFNEKFDKALKKSGGKMPSNSYQVSR